MAPVVTPYSLGQIISLLPAVVLHYIILSRLPECLEFPIETTCEVSVACFSYEDSFNVYSFIPRVAYQLAQALCIDLRELTYWHIHI